VTATLQTDAHHPDAHAGDRRRGEEADGCPLRGNASAEGGRRRGHGPAAKAQEFAAIERVGRAAHGTTAPAVTRCYTAGRGRKKTAANRSRPWASQFSFDV